MKTDFMTKIGSDVNNLGGNMGALMAKVKLENKKTEWLERENLQENA